MKSRQKDQQTIGQPKILAFDTSSAHCAVCVLCGEDILAQSSEPMTKGQAERLLGLCTELMNEAGLSYCDLTALGVGIGPGNFTGIRISVSAARGLALGLGVPSVGISSLEALSYGHETPCACAVDARRGQVYFQQFDGRAVHDPAMAPADNLPGFEGPLIGAGGQPPAHPIAVSIAHLTRERYLTVNTRPAPLYMRRADAAPSRDTPPLILP
ncbi:tRNA (adenosine(37)-N6)-threonylcarbamoyltransferase complex dimerization subunit type 1 TsaB [Roseobacter sp.]|uniref:tRNA (adenosine(37)-N6)-threonylcarbamoyltransferase complex dimerization subunit type 1 TsaB n=1 Tax=Roseobacter sp. TaxID=1907202 RepID=UPI00385BF9B0